MASSAARFATTVQKFWANTGTVFRLTGVGRLQLGFSAFKIDSIGDVTAIDFKKGGCLVHWEGYKITTADELYHTVWQNVEGTAVLTVPDFLIEQSSQEFAASSVLTNDPETITKLGPICAAPII